MWTGASQSPLINENGVGGSLNKNEVIQVPPRYIDSKNWTSVHLQETSIIYKELIVIRDAEPNFRLYMSTGSKCVYDLDIYDLTFEEKLGGEQDQYIKCKELEQNADGTGYAICYNDDGKFRLRSFGKTSRTEAQIQKNEFKFNEVDKDEEIFNTRLDLVLRFSILGYLMVLVIINQES